VSGDKAKKLHPFLVNRFTIIYVLVLSILFFASCSSLQKNYLGKAERQFINIKIDNKQLAQLDSARSITDHKADSLVRSFEAKGHTRHLNAYEVNALFSGFADQLDCDRAYNSILQKSKKVKGQLSPMQRYAAAKLLRSAYTYDSLYQHQRKVRRTLNRGDAANNIPRNIIQKSRDFLYSSSVRKKLLNHSGKQDAADSLLMRLPATNFFKETYYSLYRHNDCIINSLYGTFSFAGATLFGKKSGPVRLRAKQKKDAAKLQAQLQPFDILLSRNTNHVTAKIIPGYFGHAAIWLGATAAHKRKRLKDIFRKNKDKVNSINEQGIAEALRSGVQISSLKDFADGDVFLIIRPCFLTDEQKKNISSNALKQLHKAYDFNFDIESPDMINCTELIYLAYDFVHWKVSAFMGRYTIFPDDLLETSIGNEQFEIVALLKDGKLIEHPDSNAIRTIMLGK